MLMTIIGFLTDIALGGMAYKLARSLEVTQKQQTLILTELVHRITKLETAPVYQPKPLPFPALKEV